MSVVEINDLSHSYGNGWALTNVSLAVEATGIVGLLGSNGAGKSTLMNILCGCLSQTKGEVKISGLDVRTRPLGARRQIGFLPQTPPLSAELSVDEFLCLAAGLRTVASRDIRQSVDYVIERCGLETMRRRLIGNLSGGYKQRVGIAQAIVHRPKLVVLDEATVGLDPNQTLDVRELIAEIGTSHTVLFSTHIMSEVEAFCRDVIMIENGELAFSGTKNSFTSLIKSNSVIIRGRNLPPPEVIAKSNSKILAVDKSDEDQLIVTCEDVEGVAQSIIANVDQTDTVIEEIYNSKATLEQVFSWLSKGS